MGQRDNVAWPVLHFWLAQTLTFLLELPSLTAWHFIAMHLAVDSREALITDGIRSTLAILIAELDGDTVLVALDVFERGAHDLLQVLTWCRKGAGPVL